MPCREDDEGNLIDAFYPPVKVREGKRTLQGVRNSLNGTEEASDLQELLTKLVAFLSKHLLSHGIGSKDSARVLEWMRLVSERLEIDVALSAPWRVKNMRTEYVTPLLVFTAEDEAVLALQVCDTTFSWYRKEHGGVNEHTLFLNALTLSFRL